MGLIGKELPIAIVAPVVGTGAIAAVVVGFAMTCL